MIGLRRAAAIATVAVSMLAFLTAALGGGLAVAMTGVFKLFGLGNDAGLTAYPLGTGVLALYVIGGAIGLSCVRRPLPAGVAMLPLAALAYFFGGPVARIYGIVTVCIGGLLIATSLRGRKT